MSEFSSGSAFEERQKTDAQLREQHIERMLSGQQTLPGLAPPGATVERPGSPAHTEGFRSKAEHIGLLLHDAREALDQNRISSVRHALDLIESELDDV